jgi:AbrB family looped-hinge helix DNA binding protein
METIVDKFGRIVIPKRVRENLGLSPGTKVEIESSGDELIVKPIREEPNVVDRDGVLVFTGSMTGDMVEGVQRHHQDLVRSVGRKVRK